MYNHKMIDRLWKCHCFFFISPSNLANLTAGLWSIPWDIFTNASLIWPVFSDLHLINSFFISCIYRCRVVTYYSRVIYSEVSITCTILHCFRDNASCSPNSPGATVQIRKNKFIKWFRVRASSLSFSKAIWVNGGC